MLTEMEPVGISLQPLESERFSPKVVLERNPVGISPFLRAAYRHLRLGNRPLENYLASFHLFCVFMLCDEEAFHSRHRGRPRLPLPDTPQTRRNPMQSYLFIGGNQDGNNVPVVD